MFKVVQYRGFEDDLASVEAFFYGKKNENDDKGFMNKSIGEVYYIVNVVLEKNIGRKIHG